MTLAHVAKLWNCRPSALLWGNVSHFQIDFACCLLYREWEAEQVRELARHDGFTP